MTTFEAILIAIVIGLLSYISLSGIKTKIIIVEPVKLARKAKSDKGKKRGKRNENK